MQKQATTTKEFSLVFKSKGFDQTFKSKGFDRAPPKDTKVKQALL